MFKKIVASLAKLSSKIHVPYSRKRVTQDTIERALKVLRPGDLILTHIDGELSNIALSHWSHAGVNYIGTVYEASTHGVRNTWLIYFMARRDDFLILRPTFKFDHIALHSFLHGNLGAEYDFEFESSDKQFYCFELAAIAYMQASSVVIDPIKTIAGHQYLAKSFLNNNFKEVSF